jgi:hypothetical protein
MECPPPPLFLRVQGGNLLLILLKCLIVLNSKQLILPKQIAVLRKIQFELLDPPCSKLCVGLSSVKQIRRTINN